MLVIISIDATAGIRICAAIERKTARGKITETNLYESVTNEQRLQTVNFSFKAPPDLCFAGDVEFIMHP